MSDGLPRSPPGSPCIKLCVLGPDNICRGCFRDLSEIATWTALTADEQRSVLVVVAERRRRFAPGAGA